MCGHGILLAAKKKKKLRDIYHDSIIIIIVIVDLSDHSCYTILIEDRTNQTKSRQINRILVFGEREKPEYPRVN